ncbi:MAG: hypothetical protein IT330_10900 [Anaerolineae bacterium]|nr:hypothetical protein [Anaerolineae bacterium]
MKLLQSRLLLSHRVLLTAVVILTFGIVPAFTFSLTRAAPQAEASVEAGEVRFAGVISAVPGSGFVGDWTIGGETVHVTSATRVEERGATAAVGNWADVRALRNADNTLTATRLEVVPPVVLLKGPINGIPDGRLGVWTIAGQAITVNAETRIAEFLGPAVVGAWVAVYAQQDSGGNLVALRIMVIEPDNTVKVHGAIQQVGADMWVVSGISVTLNVDTEVEGPARIDLLAKVEARLQDDLSLLARHIEVDFEEKEPKERRVTFQGEVQSMPAGGFVGDWQVAGRTVHVTANTEVDEDKGPAQVGAQVLVKGTLQNDNSVLATDIKVLPPVGLRTIRFEGIIQSMPAGGKVGTWVISGRSVEVTERTWVDEHDGPAIVGAQVKVIAVEQADGTLWALRIEVEDDDDGDNDHFVRFRGLVEQLPNDPNLIGLWVVGAQRVMVTARTEIEDEHGSIALGVEVEVRGIQGAEGPVVAREIKVLEEDDDDDDNGTPEPSRTPRMTRTPEATGTPDDDDDDETRTPEPSLTPRMTRTPEATQTREPTRTPTPTSTRMMNEVRFEGLIESRPAERNGLWVIAGRQVEVTAATEIDEEDGPAVVGARVKVEGWQNGSGPVLARKIEVKDD